MAGDSEISERDREAAARHIEEHAFGEADQIARASRIREFVLGAQAPSGTRGATGAFHQRSM